MTIRWAKRPLDPDAVRTANEKLWSQFEELGGRKLKMGPKDRDYREYWMDSYLEALSESQSIPTDPSDLQSVPPEDSDLMSIPVGEQVLECYPELGTLYVFVSTYDDFPFEGVDVEIVGPETRKGKTDANGIVVFSDLTPGSYKAHGNKEGYGEDNSSATVVANTATKCDLMVPRGCDYLKKPYLVGAPKKNFDRIRGKSKCDAGNPGKHQFPGNNSETDAVVHKVEVKGRTIEVIAPKSGAAKGEHLPSAQQVAKALASVPGKQLDSIKQVVVSPNRNPSDPYWATKYKIKNFRSAATGGNGTVTFYPLKSPWSQSTIDSTTIHESGHTYSQELWKDAKERKEWEDIIKKDKVSPSTYADSSVGEDFSESLVMYSLSKGTPCEMLAKRLYPERYKKLDSLFKE